MGCHSLWDVVSSSFFPYMFITFALNTPPVVLGIQSVTNMTGYCVDAATWMLVNAVCCGIHMVACLYIVNKVKDDGPPPQQYVPAAKPATPTTTTSTVVTASVYDAESKKETITTTATPVSTLESGTYYQNMYHQENTRQYRDDAAPGNTWGRISHVMCYDKGVALYIIIAIGWMIYQTVGVAKLLTISGDCGTLGSRMMVSLCCGWFYTCLVGFAFLCSMCCMRL